MAGQFARRGLPVGRDDLQIRRCHRGVAVNLHARQAGKMAEAAGDGGLVFRCFHDRCDSFVAQRTFAPAKVDLAIGRERIAVVAVGAGVGGRRVTRDQMKDRELVFNRPQTVLQKSCAYSVRISLR